MKNKEIEIKEGDIVYYNDGTKYMIYNYLFGNLADQRIVKVERPVKYETIYEAPKLILDKEEKEYLEAVIRPFKNRIEFIQKRIAYNNVEKQFIAIDLMDETVSLPNFDKDTMYKGMEQDKPYTLAELGLFEGE